MRQSSLAYDLLTDSTLQVYMVEGKAWAALLPRLEQPSANVFRLFLDDLRAQRAGARPPQTANARGRYSGLCGELAVLAMQGRTSLADLGSKLRNLLMANITIPFWLSQSKRLLAEGEAPGEHHPMHAYANQATYNIASTNMATS